MTIESQNLSRFLIAEDMTVLQSMRQINETSKKILFVHDDYRLLATITDGDIRRWVISGGDLKETVKSVANYKPIFLDEDKSQLAEKIMTEQNIDAIPIIDKDGRIKSLFFLADIYESIEEFSDILPVVIMAGGKGVRLAPYTNILPKPLIPIGEIPIVEHIINKFVQYGCKDFKIIVNYKRNMIKAYFEDIEKDYSIEYINEEEYLGTGGGLSLLKGKINSTFLLTNCDIIINENLSNVYKYHKEKQNVITMVVAAKEYTIPYGVIKATEDGYIQSLVEKPQMSFYINTGCYFVEPKVIDELEDCSFIDFTSIIEKYRINNEKVGLYPISEEKWLDMGQFDELENMKKKLQV